MHFNTNSEASVPMLLGALQLERAAPVLSGAQLPRSWRGSFRSGQCPLLATPGFIAATLPTAFSDVSGAVEEGIEVRANLNARNNLMD